MASEIIKQALRLPPWKAEDRVLNVLSVPSLSPISFLKGEITQDYFGSYFIFTSWVV